MRKWVDELFIIIMDMLQDSSLLAKRQVSATGPGGTTVALARSLQSLADIFFEWGKRTESRNKLWLSS